MEFSSRTLKMENCDQAQLLFPGFPLPAQQTGPRVPHSGAVLLLSRTAHRSRALANVGPELWAGTREPWQDGSGPSRAAKPPWLGRCLAWTRCQGLPLPRAPSPRHTEPPVSIGQNPGPSLGSLCLYKVLNGPFCRLPRNPQPRGGFIL